MQEPKKTYFKVLRIAEETMPIKQLGAEPEAVLNQNQIASIDRYIERAIDRQEVPGIVIGVYKHGRILFSKGYGVGDLGSKSPVNAETPFSIGSMGKQFVSAAIMMLVEQHKVSLNDSIAKYFTDAPESWHQIKIKNLLSHTSGLADYTSTRLVAPGEPFDKRKEYTEQELIARTKALSIKFKPGERWEYSNTNYMLLGVIIHKVTKKFYFDYLRERIFKPLAMDSPMLISKKDIHSTNGIPFGYELEGGRMKRAARWSDTFNSAADGGLYCNALDLAKWDDALYGTKLLKRSTLNRIWTIFELNDGSQNSGNYGFGWRISMVNGYKVVEHGGHWYGFETYMVRYINDKITVVVLKNSARSTRARTIAHAIARLL